MGDRGFLAFLFLERQLLLYCEIQMYRNNYKTQSGFSSVQPFQSQYRRTQIGGFGQRVPLYPIGPTLAQPQFKPVQRGVSPSPYLTKQGMRAPPSYQNRYLQKAQNSSQNVLSYEQRQKRLIDRNQRQIEQQQKRREQIRMSYERQIKALTAKLNRNLEKKQKLHSEIDSLQRDQEALNQKLKQMRPPERNTADHIEHIDRKQQQMIILKNKLMNSMRQNQSELNQKQEEEQKYWLQQVQQKQKILFQLEQNLRDKRLQLHSQKQKSLQKPDFLSIEQEVRVEKYTQFVQQYQDLEKKLKNMNDQRQSINKQLLDMIELKRPQFHNNSIRREQIQRQLVNLKLRVEQLNRISEQMNATNHNLQKQLERKQTMASKYQSDIESLKSKKQQIQHEINQLIDAARNRDSSKLSKSMTDIFSKIQQDIKRQQAKGSKLKNAYQKLYQLLCSAVSKNIHQTFNQSITS